MGKMHTHERFEERVINVFGKDVYTVLGKYIKHDTKILVKHNLCGHEWEVLPSNLLNLQSKCPLCNKRIRYTTENYKERVFGLVGDEYEVLNEVKSEDTYVVMRHKKCQFEWEVLARQFIHDHSRCPLCAGLATYTNERFKEKVYELAGESYILIGEYINTSTELEIFHDECKKSFYVKPQDFMHSNSRCPICPSQFTGSSGEIKINTFLVENNFLFKREYSFYNCRNIKALPFDFAVFNKNKKLKLLIEFDGGQHYKPVEWFGGQKAFDKIKINDEIKNEYCKTNNIKLLRIPYWDFDNIDKILSNELEIIKINKAGNSIEGVLSDEPKIKKIINKTIKTYKDDKFIKKDNVDEEDNWDRELLNSEFFYFRPSKFPSDEHLY